MNQLDRNFKKLEKSQLVSVYTIVTFQSVFFSISALSDYFWTFIQHIGPAIGIDL